MKSQKMPKARSVPKQSDIIIKPDGTIHFSFLWDDFTDFTKLDIKKINAKNVLRKVPNLIHPKEEYQDCRMCPKNCGVNRAKVSHPLCGDHELRISTYGCSFGDEDCIVGLGGSGAIMLGGCPLTCYSCHNPEMVRESKASDINDFVSICYELLDEGAENIQILSPTVHLPALKVVLSFLKNECFPLPIIFKSSGYESVEELKKLNGLIDIYLPDIKFGSHSSLAKSARANDYFEVFRNSLNEMISQVGKYELNRKNVLQKGVLVRHVNAPISSQEKLEINALLGSYREKILISYNNNFVDFHN
jgi:putative pyruvate formate lyase activating enzyme